MTRSIAQSQSDASHLRQILVEKLGLQYLTMPDSVGLWLIHNRTMAPHDPYIIVVIDEPLTESFLWRLTRSGGDWLAMRNEWPTVEYPEIDIACWKLQ